MSHDMSKRKLQNDNFLILYGAQLSCVYMISDHKSDESRRKMGQEEDGITFLEQPSQMRQPKTLLHAIPIIHDTRQIMGSKQT